jgi:hypothetical protein
MMDAWFNHCATLEEAKAEYRRLCFMYHPDHGGDHEVMQTINRAYASFRRTFKPRVTRVESAPSPPPRWRQPVQPQPRPQPKRWTPPSPETAQRTAHPRSYVRGLWEHVPWHALSEGRFIRRMWGHAATLVPYPPNNSDSTWVVFVDGDLSPYLFYSREEAEQGAFEMIYDKVKFRPL